MNKRFFAILIGAPSLIALAYPDVVLAQQAAQATASAGGNGLEEIVVTARRREEKLQSIPLAVTAFNSAQIEQRHIQDMRDLALNVPSYVVDQAQADPNQIYSANVRLRGLSGTITYFDEVPLGGSDFLGTPYKFPHGLGPGLLFDLDNVEVVKGPQGTLFGLNSVGGLVSILPHKPTNDFEGYAKATFGNYSDREFEGVVNVPVVPDKLLVRVSGQTQFRDGYVTDLSTGKDLNNVDYQSWRVSVTARPTDDLEDDFVYDGYYQDEHGTAEHLVYFNPNFVFSKISLPGIPNPVLLTLGSANAFSLAALENPATQIKTYEAILGAYKAGQNPVLSFFPDIAKQLDPALAQVLGPNVISGAGSSSPLIGKDYLYGFTNKTTWDVADDLTLKNIAGARVFKELGITNLPGVAVPIIVAGGHYDTPWNDDSAQYSEELQLQGKSLGGKLDWVLGGFLQYVHPIGDGDYASTALGSPSYNHQPFWTRSQAVFAHGIYDLSDYVEGLKFTAGYRYTWDYISVQARGTNTADRVIYNDKGIATNCSDFTPDNNCYSSASAHYSSPGWNLSLEEQLDPETLIYVRSGNAYRPGSSNPNAPVQYQTLKPEHVTDVEVGVKSDWDLWTAHLRTNLDVFHTDYKQIQVSEFVQVRNPRTGAITANNYETNAATAYLEGMELEGTIIPFKGVELSPHVSYLNARYTQYPGVANGGYSFTPPFTFAPRWQYGVNATYHLPLDASLGDIAVSANYSWVGHQYDDPGNGADFITYFPSYDVLNLRIDWTDILGYPMDAAFFMTNVADNRYIVGVNPLTNVLGFTAVSYSEPRMFGFSLKYRFGGSTS